MTWFCDWVLVPRLAFEFLACLFISVLSAVFDFMLFVFFSFFDFVEVLAETVAVQTDRDVAIGDGGRVYQC